MTNHTFAEYTVLVVLALVFIVGAFCGFKLSRLVDGSPPLIYPRWDRCEVAAVTRDGETTEMLHCFRRLRK